MAEGRAWEESAKDHLPIRPTLAAAPPAMLPSRVGGFGVRVCLRAQGPRPSPARRSLAGGAWEPRFARGAAKLLRL